MDEDQEEREKTEEKKKGFWTLKKIIGVALIIALLVLIAIGIGVWRGLKDIADDDKILMVVQEGDVAKAASIYDTGTGEGVSVNVEILPALNNFERFFDAVVDEHGPIDRMLIADTDAIFTLSLDPSITFRGANVGREKVVNLVIGREYADELEKENEKPWEFRADLLNEWFDYYYDRLDQGNYRRPIVESVMDLYRDDHIQIYKSNIALTVLKYIAIEKIII
jgi:hypothetical protein